MWAWKAAQSGCRGDGQTSTLHFPSPRTEDCLLCLLFSTLTPSGPHLVWSSEPTGLAVAARASVSQPDQRERKRRCWIFLLPLQTLFPLSSTCSAPQQADLCGPPLLGSLACWLPASPWETAAGSIHSVPSNVLGAGDTAVNKTKALPVQAFHWRKNRQEANKQGHLSSISV